MGERSERITLLDRPARLRIESSRVLPRHGSLLEGALLEQLVSLLKSGLPR